MFGTDEGFASSIDLSQISNDVGGFALFGDDANNVAGNSVAAIGDINGDGLDDILVGAPDNGLNNYNYGYNGQSYVIFGTTGVTASSGLGNITAGTGGFLIAPENTYQGMGFAVAGAGDVNGDGIADLIVTAPADSDYSGAAYVVFGADGLSSSQINLSSVASGVGGFKISGSGTGDFSGMSVAAGDVNGDGIDDLLIGGVNFYGVESYYGGTGFVDVVFGGDGGFGSIDLYDIANGVGGFRIFGETTYDFAGRSVSSTDLNGDGFDDIVIGAAYYGATGAAYVVFGDDFSGVVTHLGTEFGDSLTGTENDDVIIGGAGNDFIIGNIGADVLKGGAGDDIIHYDLNGFAKIDGGLGNDTFALHRVGGTLDLAQIGDEAITGIEVIDLSEQSNTLILDAFELAALSDTGTLTVRGDGTDIVVTNDIWATDGTVTDGGDVFEVFTNSGKTLLVQDGIDVSGLQTEGIPILSLGDIDGVNGFRIVGEDAGDRAGFSVSTAGDFNGDGFEDVIVGAPYSDAAAGSAGAAYVVFGTDSGVSDISLDNVASGTSGFGFRIVGEAANDTFGISVSAAGDVNGDGFDDLIIGAKANDTDSNEGAAYVVFGTGASVTAIDLVDIAAGTGGYKILGEYISDFAGSAVSGAGDINGDGIDDILVGAQRFPEGQAGAVYVVFGSTAAGSGVNLDDVALGTGGFRIDGENANDILGIRSGGVAAVGDVNGDGVDDFVIGAEGNDAGGNRAGAAYVVFGDSAGLTSVDLADVANGTGGFKITGENAGDSAGYDVSGAGDVNGDGIADLIVGAPFATNSETEAGAAYVVFGGTGLGASIDLGAIASGNGGFKITGSGAYDYAGGAVAAGDVNGDGFDDLIVGSDGYNGGYVDVVFGAASGLTTVDLADIANGQGGFRIAGEVATDSTGSSVSSADINGDGFADIIIGSDTHPTGGTNAGAGFVVFGSDLSEIVTLQGTAGNDTLTGTAAADVIIGGTGDDLILGGGGADVLKGGSGDDVFGFTVGGFQRIEGGFGTDTLRFDGGGGGLAFQNLDDLVITGIDVIDLTGVGNNFVTLSASDVSALSDNHTLTITGNAGDFIATTDLWELTGTVNIGGESFRSFESSTGEQTLLVDLDVGTSGVNLQALGSKSLGDIAVGEGFKIVGDAVDDNTGGQVSNAGDVNGDGFEDVIIAKRAGDGYYGDEVYVVFGTADENATFDLANLGGTAGFKVIAENQYDRATAVAAAGDVNGDGFADIIIGAPGNDSYSDGSYGAYIPTYSGAAYVIFGTDTPAASIDLGSVADGTGGFKIIGEYHVSVAGFAVAGAGDMNGDGLDDIIIGAPDISGQYSGYGAAYVVFGSTAPASKILLSDVESGYGGVVLSGGESFAYAGFSVSGAGDINGDGFADVIVGAPRSNDNGYNEGGAFVVFGGEEGVSLTSVDLSSLGAQGFRIVGAGDFYGPTYSDYGYTGASVSGAGDVNGDGFADLIIGAPDIYSDTGAAYVVFGGAGVGGDINLDSLGASGFRINAELAGSVTGISVSAAGDLNGDGFDDFLIGAVGHTSYTGATYVVFGDDGLGANIDLSDVSNGTGGFRLTGEAIDDESGYSVSAAGDVNGDGFDDIIISAPRNDESNNDAGAAYILLGFDALGEVTNIGTAAADTLTGTAGDDVMIGAQGDDTLIGAGGSDVIRGGEGDDAIHVSGSSFRVDGGTGQDTLVFAEESGTLDLASINDERIASIEVIDLASSGSNNTLNIGDFDVASINEGRSLTVLGDVDSSVTSSVTWFDFGLINVDGVQFHRLISDGNNDLFVELHVQEGVDISGLTLSTDVFLETDDAEPPLGFQIIGTNGYSSNGAYSGFSVSASGDFNGDGFNDIVVGAPTFSEYGDNRGAAYVVFGSAESPASIELGAFALGVDGFVIEGAGDYSKTGYSVDFAGDINGDGFDDLLIGAPGDYTVDTDVGAAYVIFGTDAFAPTSIDLGTLDGSDGFQVLGELEFAAGAQAGFEVSAAGDLNGDGFDDFVVGAPYANNLIGTYVNSGSAYVVFGTDAGFAASLDLDLLDGTNGFELVGTYFGNKAGIATDNAGDINGDGFDDLIVGAPGYSAGYSSEEGAVYVVFGHAGGFAAESSLDSLANGLDGFKLIGPNAGDKLGSAVAGLGDVNGDGIDDVIIGAQDSDYSGAFSGDAFVVFGANGLSAPNLADISNGTGGFRIIAENSYDRLGTAVASAGDVNGDGIDDILLGTRLQDDSDGASYVIFGSETPSSVVDLANIAVGIGGFRIDASATGSRVGQAVAAGDINGDGFDDILVGASGSDEGGFDSGSTFVFFGADFTQSVTFIGTAGNDFTNGSSGADNIIGGQGNDEFNGNGGADVLIGGAGDDILDVGAGFFRVDGGSGIDQMTFSVGIPEGTEINFRSSGDEKVTGIEHFLFANSFNDFTAGSIVLDDSDVRGMSDTGTLTVASTNNSLRDQSFHTLNMFGDWDFTGFDGFSHSFVDNDSTATGLEIQDNVNLLSTGQVTLDGNQTLDFASVEGLWEINGGFFLNTETLTVQTGTLHILSGSEFDFGAGAVDVTSADGFLINDGNFAGGASPGAVTINGDISFGSSASMEFELGGLVPGIHDGYDILSISGEFEAAGTINLVEFGGFDVSAGDEFDVVQAGAMTGAFSDIVGLDVGGGVVLDAVQSEAGVTLTGRAVTHQGTAGGDTLTGGAGDDVFSGGAGADFILGGGGADLMHGGDGDDIFVAPDTGFGRIDGGDGFDTIEFSGTGNSFDLTTLSGDQINAIEGIDLTGNGDNVLTLDADSVFAATRGVNAATGTEHSLIIDGDAGDTVDAGAGWSNTGTVTIGGDGYSVYESDNSDSQLYVSNDVNVNAA